MGADCTTVCTREPEYEPSFFAKSYANREIENEVISFRVKHEKQLTGLKYVSLPEKGYFKGKLDQSNLLQGYAEMHVHQSMYYGFFKDSLPHGYGILMSNNSCFMGQFQRGLSHGTGRQSGPLGKYEGVYEHGDKKQGVWKCLDFEYEGTFKDNKFNGLGKIRYKDRTYEGGFRNGRLEGRGYLIDSKGNSYKGSFKAGKYHGYGEYTWNNGNTYKGEYFEGKKYGFGKLTIDGQEYAGNWKQGLREGHGIMTHADQNELVFGSWKQNILIEV